MFKKVNSVKYLGMDRGSIWLSKSIDWSGKILWNRAKYFFYNPYKSNIRLSQI